MPNRNDILDEIKKEENPLSPLDRVRIKYLQKLSKYTKRNIITYYSGFFKNVGTADISINYEDKNGFMAVIYQMDKKRGLDLILHTLGGNVAATESLVYYLKSIFGNNIRAIIPQIAMSAGTMIACSCKSIVMGKHSNLGPIDPQLNGIPVAGVKREFEKAYKEIKEDPVKIEVWRPILEKYSPTFLEQCGLAVERSKVFTEESLKENMLVNTPEKATNIVKELSDFEKNKAHDKHFHIDDCQKMGLTIESLEENNALQDAVLSVHHCYMHTFSNTNAVKIIENQEGKSFIKTIS